MSTKIKIIITSIISIVLIVGLSLGLYFGLKPTEISSKIKLNFYIDNEIYKTIEVDSKEKVELPKAPEKDDMQFIGWYVDYDKNIKFTSDYLIKNDVEDKLDIYGIYKDIKNEYEVKFISDLITIPSITTAYITEDNIPEFDNPKGYKLNGFYLDAEYNEVLTLPYELKENTSIYVKFVKEIYTITYHNVEGATNNNPTEYDIDSNIKLKPATKDGYQFYGWYNNKDFTGKQINEIVNSTGNLDLYAKFIKIEEEGYTVSFDTKGLISLPNIDDIKELTNEILPNVEVEGYEFKGWYLDANYNTKLETPYELNGDITLYAKLEKINYNVEYNLPEGATHNNPEVFTVDNLPYKLNAATKEGYKFEGWFLDSNYTNQIYELTELKNYTLYAKFTSISCTITYVLQDGATNPNKTTLTSSDLPYTLQNASLQGYDFKGWYLDQSYNQKIEKIEKLDNITLYGKFTKVETNTHVLTIKANNTEIYKGEHETVNIDDLDLNGFIIPDKKLYTNPELTTEFEGNKLTEDTTLYCDAYYTKFKVEGNKITGLDREINGKYKIFIPEGLGVDTIATKDMPNMTNIIEIDFNGQIKTIDAQAFANARYLEKVNLDGVVTIGNSAFYYCDYKLTEVHFPSSVRHIEKYAFQYCNSLTKITFDEGVEYIADSAFISQSGNSITELVLPKSIKHIGKNAFQRHKDLVTITIPENVEYLGDSAFDGCSNVTEIKILSEKLTYIGSNSFSDSKYWNDDSKYENNGLYINNYLLNIKLINSNNIFTLKEGTVLIARKVGSNIYSSYNFEKVILNSSNLKYIGESVFESEPKLTTVECNSQVIETIGDRAFYGTPFYKKDLVYIGTYLLKCNNVGSDGIVTLNENTTIIGLKAFESVSTQLKEVNNTKNVKRILDSAFANCTLLTKFEFGSNLEYIGDAAFSWANLTYEYIDFGANVKYIARSAFNQCKGIKSIVLDANIEYVGPTLFGYSDASNHIIYVKGDKPNPNWDAKYNYANNIEVKTYFYSETEKAGCWHYVNNKPTLW